MRMKRADVSALRMLRRARDRIDRDYADPIPGCFALMWRTGLPGPPGQEPSEGVTSGEARRAPPAVESPHDKNPLADGGR
ncbi:MAG: hypothetical protein ACRDPY_22590 [Streptosporangiaceae bacterium]